MRIRPVRPHKTIKHERQRRPVVPGSRTCLDVMRSIGPMYNTVQYSTAQYSSIQHNHHGPNPILSYPILYKSSSSHTQHPVPFNLPLSNRIGIPTRDPIHQETLQGRSAASIQSSPVQSRQPGNWEPAEKADQVRSGQARPYFALPGKGGVSHRTR